MRPLTDAIHQRQRASGKSVVQVSSPSDHKDGSHAKAAPRKSPPSRSHHSHSANSTVKRGSFSLQSGSYQYAFEPMNGYSSNNNLDFGGTFPRRRMDSIPVMVKANGHGPNGDMVNGYGRNQGLNGASGLSTPSTDSFHSSPMMSPKYVYANGQLDDISICSSDTDSFTEKFYVNENVDLTPTSSTHSLHGSSENDEHPFFSGMKDVRNPDSLQELKIVSARGTVRGVRNRVRAGIKAITDPKEGKSAKNYRVLESGKIVLYTTSMMIVRETFENCKKVKNILQTHMVEHESRDIFMSKENQRELQERLGQPNVDVPQVFMDGQHIGGAEELLNMNETGELRRIFKNYKKISHDNSCERCGGYRYIPCLSCHGSRKSEHRNHFTEEFCALRCITCDENGLIRCELCNTDSTTADSGDTQQIRL